MSKQKLTLSILSLILAINLLVLTSAFGVTAPYWETNPLVLYPGASTDVQLELQNMVGDQNITLKGTLQSSEIATITDENAEYFIPLGKKDQKVNLEINIPENTPIGTNYTVSLSFVTVSQGEAGSFGLSSSIEKNFPVQIMEKPKEPLKSPQMNSSNYLLIGVIVLIIAGIIGIVIWRKNSREKVLI